MSDGDIDTDFSNEFDRWDRDECPHCFSKDIVERRYPIIRCNKCDCAFFASSNNHFFEDGEMHDRSDLDETCRIVTWPHGKRSDKYEAMFT